LLILNVTNGESIIRRDVMRYRVSFLSPDGERDFFYADDSNLLDVVAHIRSIEGSDLRVEKL
jgi:hypothetical protein